MKKLNNKGFAISTVIYGTIILFIMLVAILLATISSSLKLLDDRVNTINDYEVDEKIESDIEPPDLSTGLIPIRYDEYNGWVVADITKEWYNYKNQEWANAVSIKEQERSKYLELDGYNIDKPIQEEDVLAWFVWIPRYSYTIGCYKSGNCYGFRLNDGSEHNFEPTLGAPGAIDIKFVKREIVELEPYISGNWPRYNYESLDSRNPANWFTHPAFWWDVDGDGERIGETGEELSGIWVGKFTVSADSSSKCYKEHTDDTCNNREQSPRILPEKNTLAYQRADNQYYTAMKFTSIGNSYGLKGDSHMMKNSEWGALAYLSQSIYGKYGNNNYKEKEKKVSCNDSELKTDNMDVPATSTTGNVYGVFDMGCGSYIRLMGVYYMENFFKKRYFDSEIEKKYYNNYNVGSDAYDLRRSRMGHALNETKNWNAPDGDKEFINEDKNFYIRRQFVSDSIFCYYYGVNAGEGTISFKAVLVKP